MLENLDRTGGKSHLPVILGAGGIILAAVLLKGRSVNAGSISPGLAPAIDSSYIPNGALGAVSASNQQDYAAAQQANLFAMQQQAQAQQFQQQLALVQAQTQAQLAIQGQNYQQQLQLQNAQVVASNSILAHAAQAKNNPYAGSQGVGGFLGTTVGLVAGAPKAILGGILSPFGIHL